MKKMLHTLQRLTGMGVAVFDAQYRCIYFTTQGTSFCRLIHRSGSCQELCKQSDVDALNQVKSTRKPCIYSCPFGFFEAVYPIMEQEKLHGYLQISPALTDASISQKQIIQYALESAPDLNADALCSALREIRHYTDEELEAVCHAASIFAEHIASNHLFSTTEHHLGELIKQYVRKNISNKITLSDMSQNLHCSTVTLTETFRREYGLTIMQYVLKKRMQMAEGMLSTPNSSFTITEVADRCGFPDVEYFSKKFKETHGVPPSLWRQEHQA